MKTEFKHYEFAIKKGFKKEIDEILENSEGDISAEFLGFLDIYEHLSKIIPKERTILDFGCAFGTQAIYFLKHKKYVGIDVSDCLKLKTPNSIYYQMSIRDFIREHIEDYKNVFAICSYVPSGEVELVRSSFNDLFVHYISNKDRK